MLTNDQAISLRPGQALHKIAGLDQGAYRVHSVQHNFYSSKPGATPPTATKAASGRNSMWVIWICRANGKPGIGPSLGAADQWAMA